MCVHTCVCVPLIFCDHRGGPVGVGVRETSCQCLLGGLAGWPVAWGLCAPCSGTGSSPHDGGLADAPQACGLGRGRGPLHSSIPCPRYRLFSLQGLLRKPLTVSDLPEGGSCGAAQHSPAQGPKLPGSWRPKARCLVARGAR